MVYSVNVKNQIKERLVKFGVLTKWRKKDWSPYSIFNDLFIYILPACLFKNTITEYNDNYTKYNNRYYKRKSAFIGNLSYPLLYCIFIF